MRIQGLKHREIQPVLGLPGSYITGGEQPYRSRAVSSQFASATSRKFWLLNSPATSSRDRLDGTQNTNDTEGSDGLPRAQLRPSVSLSAKLLGVTYIVLG